MKNPLLCQVACFVIGGALSFAEIRISELVASNRQGLTSENGIAYDWLEIHNDGAGPVNLEGYYLTDSASFSPDDPDGFWRFPAVEIGADGYLLVFASGLETPVDGELHASFRLSSGGERLALFEPDGTTAATDFTYPAQRTDVSYGLNEDRWQYIRRPTPGEPNRSGVDGLAGEVVFSVKHGFHDAPFLLTLTTATEGAEILYTLDNREPGSGTLFTGKIGQEYTDPIEISTTTVVRAVAVKSNFEDSLVRTQTYIFLEDVVRQPELPDGFPERWGSRPSDYEVDPEVVNDIYSPEEVIRALRSVPTISLVAETDDLFAADGIYTNSQAKDQVNGGVNDMWERPASAEFLNFPHGQTVQVNAGIRMQGNASRNPNRVKHNMRIVFRSDYGPGKLRFRLFEDSEVETFNSINFRSNNGDSWIHPGVRLRATYIRDQWHRQVQRVMNQPNQSQIYAHVYVNGLYWGMYHVFERFEASLLAEHYGGEEGDWDALQDTPAFQDIVVNGSDEAFLRTHALAKKDLTVGENYRNLLEYVDVDNQIDYLLLNFYSGNQDWDHKNMRYGRRREAVPGAAGNGWMYFAWDSERAGLNALNNNDLRVTMDNTGKRTPLGPSLLNDLMHANPDYHLRFADRVIKHFFNGGALTPEGATASWNGYSENVYEALIGESARWGDLHASTPETREGNWQKQMDRENEEWFPERTEVVLGQLARRGFVESRPLFPQFEPFGGVVATDQAIPISVFNASIFNPAKGEVYYTTSGEDPRNADGTVNPGAVVYDQDAPPVISHARTLMARLYDEATEKWSPLAEAFFHLGDLPNTGNLQISEIHYRPAPVSGEELAQGFDAGDFEFIELTNVGETPLDLSGLRFTKGVESVVAPEAKAVLQPGGQALIVADRRAFARRYPAMNAEKIVGEFANNTRLANEGERLTVRDINGQLIHTFRYGGNAPWPAASGTGHSLTFRHDVSGSVANPANWKASDDVGGTPGTSETGGADLTLGSWLAANRIAAPLTPVGTNAVPALLLYAFGIDVLESPAFPVLTLSRKNGGVVLHHKQRTEAHDIRWLYETSSDLRIWTERTPESKVEAPNGVLVNLPANLTESYWRVRVMKRPGRGKK